MPEACVSLWPTDACQWSVVDIWRWSDLLQKGIYISLALMLVYTLFVVIRFFRYYALVPRAFLAREFESDGDRIRNVKRVTADLSRGVGTLRAFSIGAPFLGLAGTSYGIVVVFSQGSYVSRASALGYILTALPNPLVSTAVGIVVALPAILFHNILQAIIEHFTTQQPLRRISGSNDFGSSQFAQRLPLKRRFSSFPPFSVLGVFALSCAFVVFIGFKPYPTPTGLRITVAPDHCQPGVPDRLVVLRVTNEGQLFLNTEQEDWKNIQGRLSAIYRLRTERVLYLLAEDKAPVQTVAEAIDLVRNIPATESESLSLDVRLITPQTEAENALCHGPVRRAPRAERRAK